MVLGPSHEESPFIEETLEHLMGAISITILFANHAYNDNRSIRLYFQVVFIGDEEVEVRGNRNNIVTNA